MYEVKHVIDYFGEINLPPKTGLYNKEVMVGGYEVGKRGEIVILNIKVKLIAVDFHTKKDNLIIQSQSNFEIEKVRDMALEELYDIIKQSIRALREHLKGQKNIDNHWKEVPAVPLSVVRADLLRLLPKLNQ